MIPQYLIDEIQKHVPISNKYVRHYLKKIYKFQQQNLQYNGVHNNTELHHIVPRSWCEQLIDDPDNLIVVTSEQHVILHEILSLTGDKSMIFAFWHTLVKRVSVLDHYLYAQRLIRSKQQMKFVNGRPVTNLNTGEMYYSISAAARVVDRKDSSLRNSIPNKTKCGGYYWEFTDQIDKPLEELIKEREQIRYERSLIRNDCSSFMKKVVNLNTGKVFNSLTEAAHSIDDQKTGLISQSLKKQIKARGYYWAYWYEGLDVEKELQSRIDEAKRRYDAKNALHSERQKRCNTNSFEARAERARLKALKDQEDSTDNIS